MRADSGRLPADVLKAAVALVKKEEWRIAFDDENDVRTEGSKKPSRRKKGRRVKIDEIVLVILEDGDDQSGGGAGAHYGMAAAARRFVRVLHLRLSLE